MGLHFGWNYFQIVYSQPMSGSENQSFLSITLPDNSLLFGNLYGLEGGLWSLVLRSILMLLVFLYFKKPLIDFSSKILY